MGTTNPHDDPRPPRSRAPVLLTRDDAESALYVDFEGREKGMPVVLGVLRTSQPDTVFTQWVTDDRFLPAAEAKGLRVLRIEDAIDELANEVATTRCKLVAWSEHELDMFERYGRPDATEVLRAAYRNAIPLVKIWRRRLAPDWHPPKTRLRDRGSHRLPAYMAKMGCELPQGLGMYKTGHRLASVEGMLGRKGEYALLTPTVKGQWTKVLKHNEQDCVGMRCVCLKAAADLEGERGR